MNMYGNKLFKQLSCFFDELVFIFYNLWLKWWCEFVNSVFLGRIMLFYWKYIFINFFGIEIFQKENDDVIRWILKNVNIFIW